MRPDTGEPRQLFAMEQYALVSAKHGFKVGFLGAMPVHFESTSIIGYGNYVPLSKPILSSIKSRLFTFSQAVKQFQPDVIHVRYHIGCWLLPVIARRQKRDVRMILDIRTLATSEKKHKLTKILRPINAHGYDHVFGLNQSVLDEYVMSKVSSSILPLGYDPESFYPTVHDIESKTNFVRCVYFGSLSRQRNIGILLQAVVQAMDDGLPIAVDFIGGGEDEKYLRSLVPQKYEKRIMFLGFVDQALLAEQLRSYQLGISYIPMTKIFDPNVPLKTVEMLACGLPVLGTNTMGNRSLISHGVTGILSDDDEDSLLTGLALAVQKLPYMRENRTSISDSVKEFTWPALANNYLFPEY